MKIIESKQNSQVKAWKKLHANKGRQQQSAYLIEGLHLVEEAIATSLDIKQILVTQDLELELTFPLEPIVISNEVAREISQTPSPQGIFAVVGMSDEIELEIFFAQGEQFLFLDNIQDPGNLGTMIRTADAAAYHGLILGNGTVDLYNDKVIRSTQGSMWHIPIIRSDLTSAIKFFKHKGGKVYVTGLNKESRDYRTVDFDNKFAIVIGNEGQGVHPDILAEADEIIHIPMPGQAESLNAAIAAGIVIFESIKS